MAEGDWTLAGMVGFGHRLDSLVWPEAEETVVDFAEVANFDTAGAWGIAALVRRAAPRRLVLVGLKPEFERLVRLVAQRLPTAGFPPLPAPPPWLARLGEAVLRRLGEGVRLLGFLGSAIETLWAMLPHRRHWRLGSVAAHIQHTGVEALGLVGLLSFLVGMVIAYQGASQLARYGANIFVVDLVAHSILRELAPLLVAVIVAGRSGSAFAAQIGVMNVGEEIDALRTLGLSPLEILVVPRVLALLVVMPLLTVYAEIMGLAGGAVVAFLQLDVDPYAFLDRFDDTIRLSTFLFGIGKAPVFALIVAIVGCYHGFCASGGADSVGRHTTLSVVQAIFLVIIVDAVFSVLASITRLGFR